MVLRGWHRSFAVGGTVRSQHRSFATFVRAIALLLAASLFNCDQYTRRTCWPRYRSLAGLATARCQPFACVLARFLTLLYFTLLNLGTTETEVAATNARTVAAATSRTRELRVVEPATATQHPDVA